MSSSPDRFLDYGSVSNVFEKDRWYLRPESARGRKYHLKVSAKTGFRWTPTTFVSNGDPPEYLDLLSNHERTGGIHIQGAFFRELPANACHAVDSGPSVGC